MECNGLVKPNKTEVEAEELEFLRMNMLGTPILQMTLMSAMELGVLDILVKGCNDAQSGMTADDVAAQITTQNPQVH
jgi:Dimerisation domain